MELTPIQQQALERWHQLGTTTPTHPVLQMAWELYWQPMGLEADALVYDALETLRNADNDLKMVALRWKAERVDRSWQQWPVVAPLVELAELLEPVWSKNGVLEELKLKRTANPQEAQRLANFEETQAPAIFELADGIKAASKLYIDAALECMIQPNKESEELAAAFVENPKRYSAAIFQIFTTKQGS